MPTSPENFAKVKNILQKLDQSIDAARSRRLTQTRPGTTAVAAVQPVLAAVAPTPPTVPGQPNPIRARPLMRPADGFGFSH